MAIKTYNKNDKIQLSKNFTVSEFSCHGSGCCTTVQIDEKLVEYLQKIRDHFGVPVTINSAYRCATHNKRVGGASGSRHLKGMAADISVKGIKPAEVAKYAESIGILGIGLYETASDGYFVHIDTRTTKSFWYGHAQAYRSTFGGAVVKEPVKKEPEVKSDDSLKEFVKAIQKAIGAGVDGIAGPETLAKTPTVSAYKNKSHPVVKILQKRLKELGYTEIGTADGIAGPKFTSALAHFQLDNGYTADGEATAKKMTWQKLLGMK